MSIVDPPNQIVALVGGTGAGKSTLLCLVPRFYDPNQGSVTLDGRDLRQITKKSLRAKIAIVSARHASFSTTIRENIAYGGPDATDDGNPRGRPSRSGRRIHSAACRLVTIVPWGNEAVISAWASASASGSRALSSRTRPSCARQADIRARSHHGSCHHGNNQRPHAGPNHSHCDASPRHYSRRGSDRRARAWPDCRTRHGRGTATKRGFTPPCTRVAIIHLLQTSNERARAASKAIGGPSRFRPT